jgi:hypothetical protein
MPRRLAQLHNAQRHVFRRLCGFRLLAISISLAGPGISRSARVSVTPARIAFAAILPVSSVPH